MGAPIQRGWADYLESVRVSLPPNDPLNDYVLETKVEIVLNQKGELEDTKILSSSGEKKYDQISEDNNSNLYIVTVTKKDKTSTLLKID